MYQLLRAERRNAKSFAQLPTRYLLLCYFFFLAWLQAIYNKPTIFEMESFDITQTAGVQNILYLTNLQPTEGYVRSKTVLFYLLSITS